MHCLSLKTEAVWMIRLCHFFVVRLRLSCLVYDSCTFKKVVCLNFLLKFRLVLAHQTLDIRCQHQISARLLKQSQHVTYLHALNMKSKAVHVKSKSMFQNVLDIPRPGFRRCLRKAWRPSWWIEPRWRRSVRIASFQSRRLASGQRRKEKSQGSSNSAASTS